MAEALEVLLYGHPDLRVKCAAVDRFDDGLRALVRQMERTMILERGIGLAAPQVGTDWRVLIAEDARDGAIRTLPLINPEIVELSREEASYNEGCLSLPELFADVIRPVRLRVRYQDLEGVEHELEDDGLLSRIIQHEMDHLDGVLFVDHLPVLKRKLLERKLKSLVRQSREQPRRR